MTLAKMVKKLLICLSLALHAFMVHSFTCGKPMYTGGLVIGGDKVARGEWPYVAALFYTQQQKFFCAGTLITTEHVVTAAHCIQQKHESSILEPHELVVYLGKHNLNSTFERGSVPAYVRRIFLHPDWNKNTEQYDNDIAIILLDEPIRENNYIMPACWPFQITPFNDGVIVSAFSKRSQPKPDFSVRRSAGVSLKIKVEKTRPKS